jgi:copper homeostasis protein
VEIVTLILNLFLDLNASKSSMLLEIACFSPQSATEAVKAGADRIELCTNRDAGGVTPASQDFEIARGAVKSVPIHVMIRPRGGEFEYNDEEFLLMKGAIQKFSSLGADGFVFGILMNGRVAKQKCWELVQLAGGRPCTFHRAFDELEDLDAGLRDVSACGFKAVLTSGGKFDAVYGTVQVAKLVKLAAETDVEIIVGGGVRSSNIERLIQETEAHWYHSSAIVDSDGINVSRGEIGQLKKALTS